MCCRRARRIIDRPDRRAVNEGDPTMSQFLILIYDDEAAYENADEATCRA